MKARSNCFSRAVKEIGPMTAEEFALEKEIPLNHARAYASYAKRHAFVYILKYKRESEVGNVAYPRAVYAFGDKPDAPKPERWSLKVTNMRHREKKRKRANSIFAMGIPLDDLRMTTHKRPDVSERNRKKRESRLGSA